MAQRVQELIPTAPPETAPVIKSGYTFERVTDKISSIVFGRLSKGWVIGFLIGFLIVQLLMFAITVLFIFGVGIWGIDIPVAWGFAIINFVWWIGIGHAGTLISAILLLLRQNIRTSINRLAEAMTLFAVANAAMFPILHLGRPQFFYWLVPYPNVMGVWPQFRSPLMWDFFAITTYGLTSLLFWFVGMIPDLATLRDKAKNRLVKIFYGLLSMGWRGDAKHWLRFDQAYFLLAALATPLVVSVHSVVSFDFSVGIVPGWHSTIFPPYFVAGALFSGFAMVLTIVIPLRRAYHLEDMITMRHIDVMAKIMLASGLIVAYGYLMENFMSWYGNNVYDQSVNLDRAFGPYSPIFWMMITFNVVVPQLLWFKGVRLNTVLLFLISILINVGMWTERFVIVVQSLSHDFLPPKQGFYLPTIWDIATLLGTLGLFTMLLFLFFRALPIIPMFEVRDLLTRLQHKETEPGAGDGRVEKVRA